MPLDNNPTVAWLEIGELSIVEARDLTQGIIGLEVAVVAEVTLELFVFRADIYALEDQPKISVIDYSWNDHYVFAGTTVLLDLMIEADIDANGAIVGSAAITSAERVGTGPR